MKLVEKFETIENVKLSKKSIGIFLLKTGKSTNWELLRLEKK